MDAKKQSYCWWFDSHNSLRCSPWLQSTVSELNEKTKAMLNIINEDANSFAQRAEMYYKKRPELISMVEDFYRAHKSLAERYDQLRSRLKRDSLSFPKSTEYENAFDSVKSLGSFTEEDYESEVDDPEHHDEVLANPNYDELINLRDELDRLRGENEIQKNQIKLFKEKEEEKIEETKYELMMVRQEMQREKSYLKDALAQKDEEKREVIRQLSLAMELLREENQLLKKSIVKDTPNKWIAPGIRSFKGIGWSKLFNLSSRLPS